MSERFKLIEFYYHPGYCDMLGGGHSVSLRRDEEGIWRCTCRDRKQHDAPETVTVYEVSADSVAQFEEFILKNKVLSLAKRPKSDVFATDYSPWGYSIDYEIKRFLRTDCKYCSIGEYRKYSKRDRDVLNELHERFMALRGQKISETVESD